MRHLIDSFGYSVGFIIVVLGRQQLFTESTLTAVLPVLARRDKATAFATLRLWGIVLSANLIGTFAFAAMILPDGLLRPEVYPTLVELAMATMESPFWVTMLKATLPAAVALQSVDGRLQSAWSPAQMSKRPGIEQELVRPSLR